MRVRGLLEISNHPSDGNLFDLGNDVDGSERGEQQDQRNRNREKQPKSSHAPYHMARRVRVNVWQRKVVT